MTPERRDPPDGIDVDSLRDELCGLLARLCDESPTEPEHERLNEILNTSAAAREYYLKYIAVHSTLSAMAGSDSAADAQLAVERLTLSRFAGQNDNSLSVCDVAPLREGSDWQRLQQLGWAGSVSAVILIGLTIAWFTRQDQVAAIPGQISLAGSSGAADEDLSIGQDLVAEITYVSQAAVWPNPNASFTLASRVRAGENLAISRGQVELTYLTGAKLLLTGPSEFLVRPTGGKLRRGELVARVPEAGHGFTIETPHGKVIDLGTEFGVVVDDFGVSQVSVFEGKVETLPASIRGTKQEKIELTSGRAIQWTENSVTPISVQGRRYERSEMDSITSGSRPSTRRIVADVDFREHRTLAEDWKTIGNVVAFESGLQLREAGKQRPYLLSTCELDPAKGAVNVVCELYFEHVHDAEHASVAILTRCSDSRSKAGLPWQDMLARSVRSRLFADLLSGEGLLEVGTKYEADRELSNISWSGFSQPRPSTRYRLEMRDDGLNVTFTVALVEKPSVSKTITCRSLFRGNENFIALEGPSLGGVVIERLLISQDRSSEESEQLHGQTASSQVEQTDLTGAALAKRLDALAPSDARLIIRDTFVAPEVDSAVWKTLGDVVADGGQVQLGYSNPEKHIDTWHARPYLLTKQQFDPAEGPLTIVGKVTFAENFLHGYGGSFAVMTRADDQHGGGPAWENSILRRGVRSNFWPAAYGFDHSLEIHEKPEPNTISLLLAEGFPISSASRSYLFRVVDDGHAATLTFEDARDARVQKTITHATSPTMLRAGHVGFESCWGSPCWLDEVRIYRNLPAAN